jgi:hypothetical protein
VGRWIRKTPTEPLVDLPVARSEQDEGSHQCELPRALDAGPRSVWECDCGLRWRIAVPHWRPLPSAAAEAPSKPLDLPEWVIAINRRRDPDSLAG